MLLFNRRGIYRDRNRSGVVKRFGTDKLEFGTMAYESNGIHIDEYHKYDRSGLRSYQEL